MTNIEYPKKSARLQEWRGGLFFDIVIYLFLILFSLTILFPIINMIAVSLNDGLDALRGGVYLWPRAFTLKNYAVIIARESLVTGAKITVLRTVLGTGLQLLATALLAFVLSQKDFVFGKALSFLYVMTMYVNGGIVPTFLLYRDLGLTNSFMVYILPGMVSAFNMLVIRTYINGLPQSFQESAHIDGAGYLTIFAKIISPLCLPVYATIALFIAVAQWNSWFDAMLYNRLNNTLTTLQYELMKLLSSASSATTSEESMRNAGGQVTPNSLRAAATVITALPIVCLYPFLQRYFVTGLTIGGMKE